MGLIKISDVAKKLNISTRTLRYYEEIGLVKSERQEGYAYRVYNQSTVVKLQIIIVLRKLTISLDKIKAIFSSQDTQTAIDVLVEKIKQVDEELVDLETIKEVLHVFVDRLEKNERLNLETNLLNGDSLEIIDSMTDLKERKKELKSMSNQLNQEKKVSKFENIRIVYLPPATVASSESGICEHPENKAAEQLNQFIQEQKLYDKKADFRVYGFNNPTPKPGNSEYGYEFWVTIPDDMEVKEPLTKKYFKGGLYAAHCIKMGDFHEWQAFTKEIEQSDQYNYEAREPMGMFGSLEEHINAYNYYKQKKEEIEQLDLLIPVVENTSK